LEQGGNKNKTNGSSYYLNRKLGIKMKISTTQMDDATSDPDPLIIYDDDSLKANGSKSNQEREQKHNLKWKSLVTDVLMNHAKNADLEEYPVSLALQISLNCEAMQCQSNEDNASMNHESSLSQWTNLEENDDNSFVFVEAEERSIVSDLQGCFINDYTYRDVVVYGKPATTTNLETPKVSFLYVPPALKETVGHERFDDLDLEVFDDISIYNGAKNGRRGKKSHGFKEYRRSKIWQEKKWRRWISCKSRY
jgi:hypothetical protein